MSDAIPIPPHPDLARYNQLAKTLQRACKAGAAIGNWASTWLGAAPEVERIEKRWRQFRNSNARAASCTLAAAQLFLAREHGFKSWRRFATHVQALNRPDSPVSHFEAAADAVVNGDIETLRNLLRAHPGLVRRRSTRLHRSTLLHYVSANGIEDFRQKTPPNIVEIANLLLDAGAEVDAESGDYGGGCTTLGLAATSIHPRRAGVQIALLKTLLKRGARLDLPSSAGRGHSLIRSCLANGQPEAAGFFASLGAPLDITGAAGLGLLETVKSQFREATRRQQEEAFEYACWYGRTAVVEYFLDSGIDPGLRFPDGKTGLHCAAYGAHVDLIRLLLKRGAPPGARDKDHNATPLDVALWVRGRTPDPALRERCDEAIALLT
jgi:ankyrin repeat protein